MISMLLVRNVLILFLMGTCASGMAEDGYRLWLRYDLMQDASQRKEYTSVIRYLVVEKASPTLDIAEKELTLALAGLLGVKTSSNKTVDESGAIVLGTADNSPLIKSLNWRYRICSTKVGLSASTENIALRLLKQTVLKASFFFVWNFILNLTKSSSTTLQPSIIFYPFPQSNR